MKAYIVYSYDGAEDIAIVHCAKATFESAKMACGKIYHDFLNEQRELNPHFLTMSGTHIDFDGEYGHGVIESDDWYWVIDIAEKEVEV